MDKMNPEWLEARIKMRAEQMKKDGYEYDYALTILENRMLYCIHLENIGKIKEAKELYRSLERGLVLRKEAMDVAARERKARVEWMNLIGEQLFQKWFKNRIK